MNNDQQMAFLPAVTQWRMPIVPEHYDRRPLTAEERQTLDFLKNRQAHGGPDPRSKEARTARSTLDRLNQPVVDVFRLRHQGNSEEMLRDLHYLIWREMLRRGTTFWQWSAQEWLDILCPTWAIFSATHGVRYGIIRTSILDDAYLLGGVSDLRSVGIGLQISAAAKTYFGAELLAHQSEQVMNVLEGKGYANGEHNVRMLQQCLSMLFILNRSPYLEALSEPLLAEVAGEGRHMRHMCQRIAIGLHQLQILQPPMRKTSAASHAFEGSGMAPQWYEWSVAWYAQVVDLTPHMRRQHLGHLLAIGRWLWKLAPEVSTPAQWTEDLALRFRVDVCSWKVGEYASEEGQRRIPQGKRGCPLKPQAIAGYLGTLRRFFTDLARRPHTVAGTREPKITLDFSPKEVLTTPQHIRRALDATAPRDIDLRVWARLTIAAATLSENDLPQGALYPLSFYRALGLVWVTSARRPNEIARLRLDCLREDWDPTMYDEDGHPVESLVAASGNQQETKDTGKEKGSPICYLHIPAGKNRGAFWIWLPGYVAEAIKVWKRERPPSQGKLLDQKDREEVEYLFCCRDMRVGWRFLNTSLIPLLCAKAGVDMADAKGRITGHRGRSTRLTLLRRNGVGLDDLAEYAGHANTRTVRRYANQDPLQLHQIIKDADDLSRVIEGVVDLQAAAQGLPALRWFIGYDADGEPMYCGNQVYVTCPHRLDCKRCGMFIGGEKARLLQEGEQTLPVTSKVPMTPLETCVVERDLAGTEACRATLQQVPAPETPDIRLIFNPEGLSNTELEKLAQRATSEGLDKLQQALIAHEKRLEEAKQHKTGRSALVGAQKKRIRFIRELLAAGAQRQHEQESSEREEESRQAHQASLGA
jgi:integrase